MSLISEVWKGRESCLSGSRERRFLQTCMKSLTWGGFTGDAGDRWLETEVGRTGRLQCHSRFAGLHVAGTSPEGLW